MNDVPAIVGLTYLPDFLTPEAANSLVSAIDALPWETNLSRRTQQYGYTYAHKSAALDPTYLGEFPTFLQAIAEQLCRGNFFAKTPNQVIINEYEPGQGIGKHIDATVYFGPVIASLSLLAPVEMQFQREQPNTEQSTIWLEPGSLLLLSGEARNTWKHGIAARQTDKREGITIPRKRRISVTFRTLI
jgi:alkylated DNA repair dioxygenase AlkB